VAALVRQGLLQLRDRIVEVVPSSDHVLLDRISGVMSIG
jgi:hypothetical protein